MPRLIDQSIRKILAQVREYAKGPCKGQRKTRRLVTADGEPLCHYCAKNEYMPISFYTRHPEYRNKQWQALGVEVSTATVAEPDVCAHCHLEWPN